MAFSGDHPVVENIMFDVSGSMIALVHSASIGASLNTQPALMVAGYHSSSGGGFQVSMLKLDDAGRLLVSDNSSAVGVQNVTGSVALTEPVALVRGGAVGTPLFISGSVGIGGPISAQVSGTVNLDRGNSVALPLFVTSSGTTTVTGTIALDRGNAISNPLFVTGSVSLIIGEAASDPIFITGSVIANVTGTVGLDRGNSFANPLFFTGSVGVTGSVGITNTVFTREVISTVSTGTYVLASTSVVTLQAANANRRGLLIYNLSNKAMYIKFGTGASATDFTVKVFSDDVYNVPVLYTGIITGIWISGANAGAMVTEVTP